MVSRRDAGVRAGLPLTRAGGPPRGGQRPERGHQRTHVDLHPEHPVVCNRRVPVPARPGERVKALRSGHVYLNADDDVEDVLDFASAIKWLEASVPMGPERYFLMDGEWYEIGADYVRTSRDVIGRLFPASPSVALPPWSLAANRTEYDYNSYVAARSVGRMLPGQEPKGP
jgi:uncharacterized protein (TIGR04141 family)